MKPDKVLIDEISPHQQGLGVADRARSCSRNRWKQLVAYAEMTRRGPRAGRTQCVLVAGQTESARRAEGRGLASPGEAARLQQPA